MFMQSWASNSYDAYEAFFYNLATRDQDKPATRLGEGQGTWNAGRYSNPAVDKLLAQVASETDPAKRQALIADVHKLYTGDVALIPLHQQWIAWGVRSTVDAAPLADDSVNLREITVRR